MKTIIYIFLSIFYVISFCIYPKQTLLATIVFATLFFLSKIWLKSKSRYIVSTPFFLLGVTFLFGGIELAYVNIQAKGNLDVEDYKLLGIMFILGIILIISNINNKKAGEQEVHTLSDLSALKVEREFQQAVLQDDFDTWVRCATDRGPLFCIKEMPVYHLRRGRLEAWLGYVPREREFLFQATKRVVELAEEKQLTQIGSYHIRDYYNQLGWMYEEGFGCPIDLPQAAVCYQKALSHAIKIPLIIFDQYFCLFNTAKALKRVQKKLPH